MNELVLTAHVAQVDAPRLTPAGLPALDLLLEHESQTTEAGQLRQVRLAIKAVAFGDVAQQLQRVPLGGLGEFRGFIASSRNAKGLVLHIQSFELS